MIAQSCAESTCEITNYGRFINQFRSNIIRSIRQFARINKELCTQKMSIMFNQIYIYICTHFSKSVINGKTLNVYFLTQSMHLT